VARASAYWASLLAGCILFFIIALSLSAFREMALPQEARALAIAFGGFALLAFTQKMHGPKAAVAGGCLGMLFFFGAVQEMYFATLVFSLTMLAAPMWWLGRQGKDTRKALSELGLGRKSLVPNILLGIPLTVGILLMLLVLLQAYLALGIADSEKVAGIVKDAPLFIVLLAVVVNPFTEEIFFRGFLVPRIGVLPAAAVFSLSHFAYGSVAEVVSVFFIGIVFGLVYMRRRSLVPVIVSHIIINSAAIYVMKMAF
jgi:hypothetical protein